MDSSRRATRGMVHLWYLSGNTYGGWVTFTAHLYHGLRDSGWQPIIHKIGANTETKLRNFGYDALYQNVAEEDVEQFYGKTNIIVSTKEKRADIVFDLMLHGAPIVIHDPTELKGANTRDAILTTNPPVIVIRRQNLDLVPGRTVFIPHPYKMRYGTEEPTHEHLAVSISRIDFDKKLHILLDANRLLPDDAKIRIHGFENRIYTKFQIVPDYPEWEQSKAHYEREFSAAVEICRDATFMCDMSAIKGDGGGTQYTFLEAWDAGSIPIVNRAWIDGIDPEKCVMKEGENCFVVEDGKGLASMLTMFNRILKYPRDSSGKMAHMNLIRMRAKGWQICLEHDAKKVAEQFVEVTR